MIAVTTSGDVLIGVLSALGLVASTTIPWWLSARKVKHRLGNPNGYGSISEMLETTIERVGSLNHRLEEHTAQDARNFYRINERLDALDGSVRT